MPDPIRFTPDTASSRLTLADALARLAASDRVDGLALFGSQARAAENPVSDHDLLILVDRLPIGIFQMLTHIGGRPADVVFVEADWADRLLVHPQPVSANSAAGRFLLKMQTAQIVYDASGRLGRAQALAAGAPAAGGWLAPASYADQYAAWFWQNHGLYHMQRMARSNDPVYLTACDLMLHTGLGDLCRAYFRVRGLPWEGEKAALRWLQTHDAPFLAQLRDCLAASGRPRRLELYASLVAAALAPVGEPWRPGLTAGYLDPPAESPAQLDTALEFWESLFNQTA